MRISRSRFASTSDGRKAPSVSSEVLGVETDIGIKVPADDPDRPFRLRQHILECAVIIRAIDDESPLLGSVGAPGIAFEIDDSG